MRIVIFKTCLFYFLIFVAVLTRLLPHPPNFTPIGALGLFSARYLKQHYAAYLVPLLALFASDMIIGFYHPLLMFFVYLSFVVSALYARVFLRQLKFFSIAVAACVSGSLFFLLSNFGVWLLGLYYPMTIEGLLICYVQALPFYASTVAGNLVYSFALFLLYEHLLHYVEQYERA